MENIQTGLSAFLRMKLEGSHITPGNTGDVFIPVIGGRQDPVPVLVGNGRIEGMDKIQLLPFVSGKYP